VAGAVGGAQVGLGLDQPEHQPLAAPAAHQVAAQKLARHRLDVAAVEGDRQRGEPIHDGNPTSERRRDGPRTAGGATAVGWDGPRTLGAGERIAASSVLCEERSDEAIPTVGIGR
jgi:hypothetical protein